MIGKKTKSSITDFIKDKVDKINNKVRTIKADTVTVKQPKSKVAKEVNNDTVYSLDYDKEKSDAKLAVLTNEKGKVSESIIYPSGTQITNNDDGDKIEHISKDNYIIVEGDNCVLCANGNVQISGNSNTQVDGNCTVKFAGTLKVYTSGTTVTISGGNVKIEAMSVKVDATSIDLTAAKTTITNVADGVTKGFCALPLCLFTGAPHTASSAPV